MPRVSFIDGGSAVAIQSRSNSEGHEGGWVILTGLIHHLVETAVRVGRAVFKVEAAKAGVQWTGQRLAACDQSAPPSSPIPVRFLVLFRLFLLNMGLDNLFNVANLNQHVFGFQVGVDDATLSVQVIQAQQHLLSDLLHQRQRDTPMVPPLDQTQQVLTKHLKYHAYVYSIRTLVFKRVQQTNDMFAAGMRRFRLDDAVEQFDLIDGGLGIVGGGSDHLQRDVFARGSISRQPHC